MNLKDKVFIEYSPKLVHIKQSYSNKKVSRNNKHDQVKNESPENFMEGQTEESKIEKINNVIPCTPSKYSNKKHSRSIVVEDRTSTYYS